MRHESLRQAWPATVRGSDHSLAITCPKLPPTTGYFVKPTIPFDRISSRRPCTAQCSRYIWTSRPNVCFTLPKVSHRGGYTTAILPVLCSQVYSSFLQTERSENKLGLNTCHAGQKLKLASMQTQWKALFHTESTLLHILKSLKRFLL